MYVLDDWEERQRETTSLMAARALSTAPRWVQEAVEEERKIMDLPESLQRQFREMRRRSGIGVNPMTRDIERRLRILKAMESC